MDLQDITKRLKIYQITSIMTILLTLVGFSYNVHRLEQTEQNTNIRTSSFEILKELANLEQIIYAAYYDKDSIKGNPRIGWVKVGLIIDLSKINPNENNYKTYKLYESWNKNWQFISSDEKRVNEIIKNIDIIKKEIRIVLKNLN